jgi:Tol biopolymer transport system component
MLLVLLLAGCGSPTQPSPGGAAPAAASASAAQPVGVDAAPAATIACPDAPGPIDGPIVFGADNNLFAVGVDGGPVTQLTDVPANVYAFEPAWSPDGATLAYTLSAPTSDPNLSWLPVGRICGMDRGTGKGKLLAQGAETLQSLTEASWTPDGAALTLTVHQPHLDANKVYTGESMTITRYDLASGAQQPLVKDGFNPTLSPDGQRLVYMQLNTSDLSTNLWFANQDGQAATPMPPQPETLGLIVSPRWSPDGAQIAFGASGGAVGQRLQPAARSWLERLLGVSVARAHGAPADIWLITAEGTSPQRITQKGLDDPRIAWSPDGKRIAYTNGYGGVFVLDLASKQEQMITEQGNYGGISWAR